MSRARRPMTDHRRQFRAIKGTRDILPPDSALWNWFEQTARNTFESYNFREIRPPVLEETSLFARSIGEETDVVQKEMFSFADHDYPDLENLRSAILRRKAPTISEADLVEYFGMQVSQFLNLVKEELAVGELPRTPENLRLREDLPVFFARLVQVHAKYRSGSLDSEDAEVFDLNVGNVRQLISSV